MAIIHHILIRLHLKKSMSVQGFPKEVALLSALIMDYATIMDKGLLVIFNPLVPELEF